MRLFAAEIGTVVWKYTATATETTRISSVHWRTSD
jgi:hypothetical protein